MLSINCTNAFGNHPTSELKAWHAYSKRYGSESSSWCCNYTILRQIFHTHFSTLLRSLAKVLHSPEKLHFLAKLLCYSKKLCVLSNLRCIEHLESSVFWCINVNREDMKDMMLKNIAAVHSRKKKTIFKKKSSNFSSFYITSSYISIFWKSASFSQIDSLLTCCPELSAMMPPIYAGLPTFLAIHVPVSLPEPGFQHFFPLCQFWSTAGLFQLSVLLLAEMQRSVACTS